MSKHENQSEQGWLSRYNFSLYRALFIVLLLVFAGLQYRLWISDGSMAEVHRLKQTKQQLQAKVDKARARNKALAAEIRNLQSGKQAMVGRARTDVGMIKKGETFYLTVDPSEADNGKTDDGPNADDEKDDASSSVTQ